MDALSILELWYSALNEPLGLVVPTTNPEALRLQLYRERTKAGDPQLDVLSIITSPTNPAGELWIAHRNNSLTEEDIKNAQR